MNRIIVDVTQLVHWPGMLTGIPRVMKELAVRFQSSKDWDATFVTWTKELHEFCEIDLDKTLAVLGRDIIYVQGSQPSVPASAAVSGPSNKTIIARPIKKGAIKIAKKGFSVAKKFAPGLGEKLESQAKLMRMRRYKQVGFEPGDLFFVPWGEWWDPHFIAKLEQLSGTGVRLVQVLHDMSPIMVPQFSNSGNAVETFPIYFRRIFPITSLVLSVSENSRKDAINWLKDNKLSVPAIEVFRLGDDIKIANPVASKDPGFKASGLNGQDFILFVGTIELKKNHMLLYYVYKLAKSRGIDLPKLVIVGRRGWMSEATFELMTVDPEVKDKFVFLLNTSDEELSWLYDKCLFTILPSFYEGWGIPIAESVARGVPCISSNTSSMTEIAKGYVEHFSPTSTEECLSAIERLLNPAKLKAARQKVKSYKRFSWDESFQQISKHIKEIV